MRLSYQAGAIRALLDAGLCFAHMDGTSGGSLNLSMLLSGLSPEQCCERWRTQDPKDFASLMPLQDYLGGEDLLALADADGVVQKVLPHLGIDVSMIRAATGIEATYNVCNFALKRNEVITHQEIDRDLIVAGMSLPGVMPPVLRRGTPYIDSAFIQDANLMEAVRRGAEEIWLVWGMGNTPSYRGGVLRLYVQMLEMSAAGALNIELERIAELNERIAKGDSPYGQRDPIQLHVVRPEYPLPLDPDLYLGRVHHGALIEWGYADARAYLASARAEGVELSPSCTQMREPARGVRLREELRGPFGLGETVPEKGRAKGERTKVDLALYATIEVQDVDAFVAGAQAARLTGRVDFDPFAPGMLVYAGQLALQAPPGPRSAKVLTYQVSFDHAGEAYTLLGRKELLDEPGLDFIADATTLYAVLHRGTVGGETVGAGILRLDARALLELAKSTRATSAGSAIDGLAAIGALGRAMFGSGWISHTPRM